MSIELLFFQLVCQRVKSDYPSKFHRVKKWRHICFIRLDGLLSVAREIFVLRAGRAHRQRVKRVQERGAKLTMAHS